MLIANHEKTFRDRGSGLVKHQMPKYLNQIKALKKINKSIVTNNKFLINKEGNIKIYIAFKLFGISIPTQQQTQN